MLSAATLLRLCCEELAAADAAVCSFFRVVDGHKTWPIAPFGASNRLKSTANTALFWCEKTRYRNMPGSSRVSSETTSHTASASLILATTTLRTKANTASRSWCHLVLCKATNHTRRMLLCAVFSSFWRSLDMAHRAVL